ncbi:MAG: hypothetical protein ACK5MT_14450 [Actinomycetales bacterium]
MKKTSANRTVRRTQLARLGAGAITVVALGASLGIGPAVAAPATTELGSELSAGTTMTATQYLASPSGQHEIAIDGEATDQNDDAVGVYLWGWSGNRAYLNTNMNGLDQSENELVMQSDGNLVLYNAGTAYWNSGTAGNEGARAVLQDDGNFVVYSASGTPLYNTGTVQTELLGMTWLGNTWTSYLDSGWSVQSPDGRYRLIQQSDGNLVAYSPTRAVWWSGTVGANGIAAVQQDCNVVVYDDADSPVWTTGTSASTGFCTLAMQSDGNVVLYRYATATTATPTVLWQSATAGA